MKIPDLYKDVLSAIQDIDPMAIIAGGCLRDLDHGINCTDIDIFTPGLPDRLPDGLTAKKSTTFYFHQGADRVIKARYKDQIDVDIVEVKGAVTLWNILNKFDYGINRIAYDGDRVHTSLAYEADKKNKTITMLYVCNASHFRFLLEKYEKRLKVKFPEHKLVVPGKIAEQYNYVGDLRDHTIRDLRVFFHE